jgi:S1-C subfamily serine protease
MDEPRKNSAAHEGNSVAPIVITTIVTTLIVVGIAWLVFYSNSTTSPSAQQSSYYLEHGDYSVYFPAQPTYSLTSQEITNGNNVADNNYTWRPNVDNSNDLLEATYISSPFVGTNLTPEENLKREGEYTGNTGGSSLISLNPTTYHGLPAIDYVILNQSDKTQSALYTAGRDILKGNDLYMLEYGYFSGQEDKQLENTFLNSLTFGKTPNSINIVASTTIQTVYTTGIANVRSCASVSCAVVAVEPSNAGFTLKGTKYGNITDISQLPEWVDITLSNGSTIYINRGLLSDHEVVQQQVVQNDSTQTHVPVSVGTFCNGISYSACPTGQDFVCPASGDKAFCQTVQQAQASAPPTDKNLSTVIEEWHPFIAYIVCNFSYADGSPYSIQGSGTVSKTSGEIAIVTNRHVVTDSNGNAANSCKAIFPLDANQAPLTWTAGNYQTSLTLDLATLPISNPSPYIKSLSDDTTNRCPTQPPIGEEIVILGYPTNGSKTDITATEGIISGYDGDYYITSAKVDHGNSGGAAIDAKNDCFLGIPTYYVGDVESLARVLKWQSWY